MLEGNAVYSKLTGIFRDIFDDETIEATPYLTAKDVDGWDSLTHIRLLLTIEKSFSIKFSNAEIGNLQTVGDLAALIQLRA